VFGEISEYSLSQVQMPSVPRIEPLLHEHWVLPCGALLCPPQGVQTPPTWNVAGGHGVQTFAGASMDPGGQAQSAVDVLFIGEVFPPGHCKQYKVLSNILVKYPMSHMSHAGKP